MYQDNAKWFIYKSKFAVLEFDNDFDDSTEFPIISATENTNNIVGNMRQIAKKLKQRKQNKIAEKQILANSRATGFSKQNKRVHFREVANSCFEKETVCEEVGNDVGERGWKGLSIGENLFVKQPDFLQNTKTSASIGTIDSESVVEKLTGTKSGNEFEGEIDEHVELQRVESMCTITRKLNL